MEFPLDWKGEWEATHFLRRWRWILLRLRFEASEGRRYQLPEDSLEIRLQPAGIQKGQVSGCQWPERGDRHSGVLQGPHLCLHRTGPRARGRNWTHRLPGCQENWRYHAIGNDLGEPGHSSHDGECFDRSEQWPFVRERLFRV